ncbi:hypothetical protein [Brunnivagina elsteri]|nr:hypothetical protein [Calothrix elsteri]
MSFCKQLELFDMRPYTTKQFVSKEQFITLGVSELHFKNVLQPIEYIQLELNLFPSVSNLMEIEFLELAA